MSLKVSDSQLGHTPGGDWVQVRGVEGLPWGDRKEVGLVQAPARDRDHLELLGHALLCTVL